MSIASFSCFFSVRHQISLSLVRVQSRGSIDLARARRNKCKRYKRVTNDRDASMCRSSCLVFACCCWRSSRPTTTHRPCYVATASSASCNRAMFVSFSYTTLGTPGVQRDDAPPSPLLFVVVVVVGLLLESSFLHSNGLFLGLVGLEYLRTLLQDLVIQLMQNEDISFEIDPEYVPRRCRIDDQDRFPHSLLQTISSHLQSIVESCPRTLATRMRSTEYSKRIVKYVNELS